jgi:deoxyribodipyrimidine photo-lyase
LGEEGLSQRARASTSERKIGMPSLALVWLKRDLRLHDHAALAAAAACDQAVALYIIEPAWLASPEFDAQHLAFALAGIQVLQAQLAERGLALCVRQGEATAVLQSLRREYAFTHLFSHEETGPLWSYRRDLDVQQWARSHGVIWSELPQTGVVRRLRSRSGWAAQWQKRMGAQMLPAPRAFAGSPAQALVSGDLPSLTSLGLPRARPVPPTGAAAAHAVLEDFLHNRGRDYRRAISSPLTADRGCSRLSAYLSFGMISMRHVHQVTEARIDQLLGSGDAADRNFAYNLRGFSGRLRWHCHFMQKLEDEPLIEERNFARSADGLRENAFNPDYFEAWRTGHTGFPMVDACMRGLNATGWLNFRMRAMLVSFASYHLWLHWRATGLYLAQQFLDFEPGIHWSQMQMQSGTTGINTLRIYSPTKQMADHDPGAVFVRRWVPEWGSARYPAPIVDEKQAVKAAKDRLYALRKRADTKTEAQTIQDKHGSRKSGLPPTAMRSRRSVSARPSLQGDLFS